jgi:dihydroorotase
MKYDLLLSGATVIDPSQGIDAVRDVAVKDGLIAAVSEGIDTAAARERVDLSGRILTPGWIDIHAHVYAGATTWGIKADAHCLATGVTTIVDAGSPGWANFIGFKEFVADVHEGRFPGPEHVVHASDNLIGAFVEAVDLAD